MAKLKKAQDGDSLKYRMEAAKNKVKAAVNPSDKLTKSPLKKSLSEYEKLYNKDFSAPKKKMGGMIKRADGSYSKRGLWDNIRANKGSGKKPTSAMLKQEKKIKAQTKKK
jgi:hypothetical protein